MIKTIKLLQDSYPELNLQLAYDFINNIFTFSGNETPRNLCGHGRFATFSKRNINIVINSVNSPEISGSFLNGLNDSRLYIGGTYDNPVHFSKTANMSKEHRIINILFGTFNLNKQIKIL